MSEDYMELTLGEDEDDMEGYGFGDVPDLPQAEQEEEQEPKEEPDGSPSTTEPAEDTDPRDQTLEELRQAVAMQQQMVVAMQQQMAMQQQSRQVSPATDKTEKPEFNPPTDEEWAENPGEAARRVAAHEYTKAQSQAAEPGRSQADPHRDPSFQGRWRQAETVAAQMVPEATQPGAVQSAYVQIMGDQTLNLRNHPAGPMFGVLLARELAKSTAAQNQTGPGAERPNTGAQPAQGQRGKAPVVHRGGRQRSSEVVKLTPDQRREARRAGVSEAAYAETLKTMGGM